MNVKHLVKDLTEQGYESDRFYHFSPLASGITMNRRVLAQDFQLAVFLQHFARLRNLGKVVVQTKQQTEDLYRLLKVRVHFDESQPFQLEQEPLDVM